MPKFGTHERNIKYCRVRVLCSVVCVLDLHACTTVVLYCCLSCLINVKPDFTNIINCRALLFHMIGHAQIHTKYIYWTCYNTTYCCTTAAAVL